MEDLKEIIQVVSKNKVKEIHTLDYQNRGDRVYDFYSRMLSDQFQSDADAAAFYYKNPAQRGQYRKLKAKLRDRLHNTLFFIDVNNPKFTDAQKAFYQCHKELVAIRLLTGRSARKAANALAKRTLAKARKYELLEVVVEILRLFKRDEALYGGNLRKYQEYSKQLRKYDRLLHLENMAMDHYEDIHIHYRKHLVLDKKVKQLARTYIDELRREEVRIKTFRYHIMKFALMNLVDALDNKLEKVVENCDQAIRFFANKPHVSAHFLGSFYLNKILSLAKLGQYQKGQKIARSSLRLYEKGTRRWFRTNQLYFYLAMHSKQYLKALEILDDVTSQKEFHYEPEAFVESWRLNQAYLFYLLQIGKLRKRTRSIEEFRVNKFLNEVPQYSSAKRGYNIPVLIIQILILIQEGKYDQLTDRIEAIEKYTTRYLKRDTNFRSNCFIKMLLQVPKRHFHKAAVVRHAKPYLKRLVNESDNRSNQNFEMEIIPYEHLWEHVLETLDLRFH